MLSRFSMCRLYRALPVYLVYVRYRMRTTNMMTLRMPRMAFCRSSFLIKMNVKKTWYFDNKKVALALIVTVIGWGLGYSSGVVVGWCPSYSPPILLFHANRKISYIYTFLSHDRQTDRVWERARPLRRRWWWRRRRRLWWTVEPWEKEGRRGKMNTHIRIYLIETGRQLWTTTTETMVLQVYISICSLGIEK